MDVFYALSDPTRRQILQLLAQRGKLSAAEVCAQFSVSPPAISQHLKVLKEANLVQMEKHAQQRIYRLNPAGMAEVEGWAHNMTSLWNERLDALDRLLQEEQDQDLTVEKRKEK